MCEPVAGSAAQLRHQLRGVLWSWRLPQDVVDDAVVISDELAANAIVHAGTTFHVSVELHGPLLRITIADSCARPPQRRTRRGRGLRTVTHTALRWGWQEYDAGKTIWAEVFV